MQYARAPHPPARRDSSPRRGVTLLPPSGQRQSSFLSQISQIIFVKKKLSCGDILGFFGKFWEILGDFATIYALSFGEKMSPKSTFVEKNWQIWGLGWYHPPELSLGTEPKHLNSHFSHHKLALGQLAVKSTILISLRDITQRNHSKTSLKDITQRYHSEKSPGFTARDSPVASESASMILARYST